MILPPKAEKSETSGRSRWPSFGMPSTPVCHDGFGHIVLGPPLPAEMSSGEVVLVAVAFAQMVRLPDVAVAAQESFQGISGM